MIEKNSPIFLYHKIEYTNHGSNAIIEQNKILSFWTKYLDLRLIFCVLTHDSCAMPESDLKTQLLISKEGHLGSPVAWLGGELVVASDFTAMTILHASTNGHQ